MTELFHNPEVAAVVSPALQLEQAMGFGLANRVVACFIRETVALPAVIRPGLCRDGTQADESGSESK